MTEKGTEKILKKIKIEMAKKGINQSQLAEKLGLTHAAVSAWFNGKSTPNLEMLLRVFGCLEKDANYFFNSPAMIGSPGNNNSVGNSATSKDLELVNAKIEVLQKMLENLDLRIKILENAKTTGSL